MSELRDVVVASRVGSQKHAEATEADLEEQSGMLRLIGNVQVWQQLVYSDEYTVTSKNPRHTLQARYLGPDTSSPGALLFSAVPKSAYRRA